MAIKLLVGLGNPGVEYAATRHNAGAWLIEALARQAGQPLRLEPKFHSMMANLNHHGCSYRILIPTTFMNRSGQAVKAATQFYQILPEEILVIHDELDLSAGTIRLKFDGGHGGHNGLRDIIAHLHSNKFYRMRVGIGHPGDSKLVSHYVLNRPTRDEQQKIETAIELGLQVLPLLLSGEAAKATQQLNTSERK